MKAYHITQWNPLYEKADTRKTDYMGWFCKQTKLVGIGIGKTMREPYPRNAILYGLWTIIETLASQSAVNERGWLIRGGKPLEAESLADLVPTIPPAAFQEALDWFSQPKIGWLEMVECPHLNDSTPGLFPEPDPKTAVPPEATGRNSRPVPVPPEATGRNSATERQTERESTDRQKRERDTLTRASHSLSGPTVEEVETWAVGAGVDPTFAVEKLAQAVEREDFAQPAIRKHWPERFLRFWKADEVAWRRKRKKNAAAAGERPDGWKAGDASTWWTDGVAELRGALHGAVSLGDKKTAARLREVLACREGKT